MLVLSRNLGAITVVPPCELTVTLLVVEHQKARLGNDVLDDIDTDLQSRGPQDAQDVPIMLSGWNRLARFRMG
jgi:hypothetical protein